MSHLIRDLASVTRLEEIQAILSGGKIKIGEIDELEPLFTEARDEIGDITATLQYETSPTYSNCSTLSPFKVVRNCFFSVMGEPNA